MTPYRSISNATTTIKIYALMPDAPWAFSFSHPSISTMVKLRALLPLLLPLLFLQQHVEAQRTLVSLSKKLKHFRKSEEHKKAAVSSPELDVSGRWNPNEFFSSFFDDDEWNLDDYLAMGTTLLLVVTATSSIAMSILRAEGEYL
jgi:hypothetical protein